MRGWGGYLGRMTTHKILPMLTNATTTREDTMTVKITVEKKGKISFYLVRQMPHDEKKIVGGKHLGGKIIAVEAAA